MELRPLIAHVQGTSDEPLARIEAAALLRREIEQVGDDLVDHFVKDARAGGCSWAQIGDALGVTRQAAQQRHGGLAGRLLQGFASGLFTRFTARARQVVVAAQEDARARRHPHVGTEHLLLGLFAGGEPNVATIVLDRLGVDTDAVRRQVDQRVPAGEVPVRGHIPFTKGAKQALELSLREALRLGHNYVGCEHLVLALSRGQGTAADVLVALGATHDRLDVEVRDHLRGLTPAR